MCLSPFSVSLPNKTPGLGNAISEFPARRGSSDNFEGVSRFNVSDEWRPLIEVGFSPTSILLNSAWLVASNVDSLPRSMAFLLYRKQNDMTLTYTIRIDFLFSFRIQYVYHLLVNIPNLKTRLQPAWCASICLCLNRINITVCVY